ncbi:MAG: cupin domain-containing protein [Pseudoxanthomonas sp.]
MTSLDMKLLGKDADYLAPDGSEIRLLADMRGGGLCHCTLPPGAVSRPVSHGTVEEIWYFLDGDGQVWRRLGDQAGVVEVGAGTSLTIPPGAAFQFRNTGAVPLRFLIVTMPPWPGPDEAVPAEGFWR